MALESELQKKITAYLKDNNYFYFKIISASINGVPDIFAIIPSGPVFIEVKRQNGGRLSRIQEYQIDRIRKNGIKVAIINNFNDFLMLFT